MSDTAKRYNVQLNYCDGSSEYIGKITVDLPRLFEHIRMTERIDQGQTIALMLDDGATVIFRENVRHIRFHALADKLEGKAE